MANLPALRQGLCRVGHWHIVPMIQASYAIVPDFFNGLLDAICVCGAERFGKPVVDRSEQFGSLQRLALVTPEPRRVHRRAQFPTFWISQNNGEAIFDFNQHGWNISRFLI